MKKVSTFHIMLYALIGITGITTSCQEDRNLYNPDNVQHTTELKIPKGFDWLSTRSVSFAISSPITTMASVYLDKSCTAEQQIATIPVSAKAANLTLDIPAANDEIYVQFPLQNGQKEVMTVALPAVKSKSAIEIKLPENPLIEVDASQLTLTRVYNRGTVMFEDNWPELGDYDFNDFVITYDIQTDYSVGDYNQGESVYQKEGITVTIQFRAIGGALPYRLGLQLDKTLAKYIDKTDLPKTKSGITVSLQNPGADEPAIFIFDGTNSLKGKNGGQYYNTEAQYAVSSKEIITISFRIDMNSYNNMDKFQNLISSAESTNHNFFLQNGQNGSKEIHLRGYQPTSLYKSYAVDAKDLMNPEISYCSAEGFVWGIKVPKFIPHATERTDFMKAFPNFKEWVISGGQQNENWYKYWEYNKVIQN